MVVITLVLTCLVPSLRNLKGNVQLQVDALHGCHVVQYERKLLSLETRKKRRRHLSHRHASGKRRSGRLDVFCFHLPKQAKESATEQSNITSYSASVSNKRVWPDPTGKRVHFIAATIKREKKSIYF